MKPWLVLITVVAVAAIVTAVTLGPTALAPAQEFLMGVTSARGCEP